MDIESGVDAIIENPHLFGMPTFDEFCKNRDYYLKQWKLHNDSVYESADTGSIALKRETKEHWYYWGLYKSKNIYEIVKIVKNEGYTPDDITFDVLTEKSTAGKLIFHVKYRLKKEERGKGHGRDVEKGVKEGPDSEA